MKEIKDQFLDHWTLGTNDMTAHYITNVIQDDSNWFALVAACGVSFHASLCEAVINPMFKCLRCANSEGVKVT